MTNTLDPAVKALTAALSAPFGPTEIKWKPQAVKGNRAMALAYLDARAVQDRLDAVFGVEGWQDEYQIQADGSVVCKLQCLFGDRWVTKMDVGGMSEQPDGGDRMKSAFSDALKRAAVKFGVGRYLYRLTAQWADYDPVKKQFLRPPELPPSARPKVARQPEAAPTAVKPTGLPADGDELHRRLRKYDAALADRKACGVGALLSHVAQAGAAEGYGDDISRWDGPAIPFAVEAVKRFNASLHQPESAHAA